jgi:hypothetical protein
MKTAYPFFAILSFLMAVAVAGYAQGERKDKTAVTYEEIYDEPYSVNKLFVNFQPLYGEVFATNINAGFGLEASYYLKDKADFKAHFRKTYSEQFYDYGRYLAAKNSDVDNKLEVFNYYEFGGTYHIKDFEQPSKTKMFLYKSSYKGNKWAARVPLTAEVPCKVRKIYGARLGGIIWDSSVELTRVIEDQGLTYDDFQTSEGVPLSDNIVAGNEDLFSNVYSRGAYLGGSFTWIRNVAVSFDKFEAGVDDLIFTAYLDLMFAPSLKMDEVVYTPRDVDGFPIGAQETYQVDAVKLNKFGFRAGIEGKFNRTLSWAYGGEIGYRPSVDGKMFYALIKISFPVFGTNLDYGVEAFGK